MVFISRYMDLFWSHPFSYKQHKCGSESDEEPRNIITLGLWNFFLKIFYILSSLYIIFLMMRVYGRTHERERAWKFGYACLGGSLLVAVPAMLALTPSYFWSLFEVRDRMRKKGLTWNYQLTNPKNSTYGPFPRSSNQFASCPNYFSYAKRPCRQ